MLPIVHRHHFMRVGTEELTYVVYICLVEHFFEDI